MKRIVLIAGARPNFMKIAPLHRAFAARGASQSLVHTGQHFDKIMSDAFFDELEIPAPDTHLGIGAGDRIAQTRKIVQALVPLLQDWVIVVGDVTSTAAGAFAGVLAGIPVAHVEAGLRSFNWMMPEELNRMAADHHSDLLFVSDPAGLHNLRKESIPDDRVHYVGNVMVDTLHRMLPKTHSNDVLERLGISSGAYGVMTMHRPENVDHPERLASILRGIERAAADIPIVWPVHHRTKMRMEEAGRAAPPGVRVIDPVAYLDMLTLMKHAKLLLTDSGGLQEEATVLGIPCITLRGETERPVTVTVGTSEVVGCDYDRIVDAAGRALRGEWKKGGIPEGWDGKASERIADILLRH
jgi:UDP-N-acetylglucosamine 2-epimerase (non-hydrolysing)